ncbi:hypothetical protein [Paractinoplanes atraurantiacus]|uniref:dTDP-4-amino-4,6-dideoxygalactose transaminase n=1 Tax=Paractinoplanes atraurantiacus TaxID=1036182 RepID=A0A285J9E9_9ACTN|nr:hypothetical protein [Actinoplanes atraurantiacus]SNY56507.1 hypothetical protein SAMN05421748_117176 [Actinoplanes atraurantiacus]
MPPDIGSEFHWEPAVLGGDGLPSWLPERRALFATACGALHALLRLLRPRGRLFVPSYFCTGVAESLSHVVPIAWYRHLPDALDLNALPAVPGDVVLAQNLFAREAGVPWRAWIEAHPAVPVIEDHSHDPFGEWPRHSTAAYAVASLRKTLPLPDGGLLWSPSGRRLPAPSGPPSPGSDLKLAAMLLKSAWLNGGRVPRDAFRALQQQGEQALLCSSAPPCATTAAALPLMDTAGVRRRSTEQAQALAALLPTETPDWHLLPPGPTPFRLQLVCRTEPIRDALQHHLAQHHIFAPVHWRQTAFWSHDEQTATLASRMLTLPVDHRCTESDLHRLASVISSAGEAIGARGGAGALAPPTQ